MSELPDRVRRAFRDADAFELTPAGTYRQTTTTFDAEVAVSVAESGETRLEAEVRMPMLSAVVEGDVAEVVEDGWYDTLVRRVVDVGGVTAGDHDLDPTVERADGEAVARVTLVDIDPTRGAADAKAFVDFVEGTYVQGIIPGYEYTEPAAGLVAEGRRAAGEE
ncbi:MAG: hypothetical protein A07HB70_02085 [uncultured archaeon A07HB70]|nr:MAG: hypothetical protein A07HB70_02085 [uncultured archaeon A07HB70]